MIIFVNAKLLSTINFVNAKCKGPGNNSSRPFSCRAARFGSARLAAPRFVCVHCVQK